MAISGCIRDFSVIGVPLFLILTGYLNDKKTEFNRKYLIGITRVLVACFLFSLIGIFIKVFFLQEEIGFLKALYDITTFKAIGSYWYIKMYIGLYLLIPFLNILYNTLESKRKKHILIGTFLFITAIPKINVGSGEIVFLPNFWESLFPVTFFMIGRYIKEFQPSLQYNQSFFFILFLCIINIPINYIIGQGHHTFIRFAMSSEHDIFAFCLAIVIFLVLYQRNIHKRIVKKQISMIAFHSLNMYLISVIVDYISYPYILTHFNLRHPEFGILYVILVPITFLLSYIISLLTEPLIEYVKNKIVKALIS